MNTFFSLTLCFFFFSSINLFAQKEDKQLSGTTISNAEMINKKGVALNLAIRSAEFNSMIPCQDTNLYKNLKLHSYFFNESFEKDKAKMGKMPINWENCGAKDETPIDIHGKKYAYFGVTQKAQAGDNFVALITRENNTVEGMGQRLQERLKKNTHYIFRLHLARADHYSADGKKETAEPNYNQPVVLRIWGGNSICEKNQILAQTPPIKHQEWEEYTVSFTAAEDTDFIILEAYFSEDQPYNGNLLIDEISPIFKF